MKKLWLFLLFLCGCNSVVVPDNFVYAEIQTSTHKLASWQKITNAKAPVRIYVEGDGFAFNYRGQPSANPTPKSGFWRNVAFNDPNANVIYLARPCQFVRDNFCKVQDWTTGRFSQSNVTAVTEAVEQLAKGRDVVLLGHSGGALMTGLVIEQNRNIKITKWITVAGLFNHQKWTMAENMPPLTGSLNLEQLPQIKQVHFVGQNDDVISLKLQQEVVTSGLVVVPNAGHNHGFESIYSELYQ